jgi:hypothetical protein
MSDMIDDVDSLGTVEFAGLNPEWILHQSPHIHDGKQEVDQRKAKMPMIVCPKSEFISYL